MSDPVRTGGRAVRPDGAFIVWSVAEGLRGRRWRESITRSGGLGRSLLLEASPGGGPRRLELTTASGLLTLHPDEDGRLLHGNVVTPEGVRHLRFDWSFEHELVVLGSPAAAAIALRRFAEILAVGETRPVPVVAIDDALEPRAGTWEVTRTGTGSWTLGENGAGEAEAIEIDAAGLPLLPGAETWPLALD
ncbi:MAG: hypothetical protein ABI553_00170 [Chloroflexota bacterium]